MSDKNIQPVSAIDIAKLLLSFDEGREYFRKQETEEEKFDTYVGNFRLNKLLHICYMLYYSKHGEPLFYEELRAYPHGAIVYPVFKNFPSLHEQILKTAEINLAEKIKKFVDKVFRYFKTYHDKDLETFSHDDIAWKERFKSHLREDSDTMVINDEVKSFYRDILGHIVREVGLSQYLLCQFRVFILIKFLGFLPIMIMVWMTWADEGSISY